MNKSITLSSESVAVLVQNLRESLDETTQQAYRFRNEPKLHQHYAEHARQLRSALAELTNQID